MNKGVGITRLKNKDFKNFYWHTKFGINFQIISYCTVKSRGTSLNVRKHTYLDD